MAKKSNARVRRMQERAKARGETYAPPEGWTPAIPDPPTVSELEAMNAKERRSAKNKMKALGQEPKDDKNKKKYKKRKKGGGKEGDSVDKIETDEATTIKSLPPLFREEEVRMIVSINEVAALFLTRSNCYIVACGHEQQGQEVRIIDAGLLTQ